MAKKGLIGMDKLHAKFAAAIEVIDEAVIDSVREGAEAIRDGARRDVPKDKGVTAEGIDILYTTGGRVANIGERDASRTHVAEFLENGTASITAQPFMAPNAKREKRKFPKRIETNVAKRLEGL